MKLRMMKVSTGKDEEMDDDSLCDGPIDPKMNGTIDIEAAIDSGIDLKPIVKEKGRLRRGFPSMGAVFGKGATDTAANDGGSVSSGQTHRLHWLMSSWVVAGLVIILGAGTAAAFFALGISSAKQDQEESFGRSETDLVKKIQGAWEDYMNAASWMHGRSRDKNFTREEFRELYEYLVDGGLDFQAAQYDPYVPHDRRPAYEAEAREY